MIWYSKDLDFSCIDDEQGNVINDESIKKKVESIQTMRNAVTSMMNSKVARAAELYERLDDSIRKIGTVSISITSQVLKGSSPIEFQMKRSLLPP